MPCLFRPGRSFLRKGMPLQTGNGLLDPMMAFHREVPGLPRPVPKRAVEFRNIDQGRTARIALGTPQTGPDLPALQNLAIEPHGGFINHPFWGKSWIFTADRTGSGTMTAFHARSNLFFAQLGWSDFQTLSIRRK